MSRNNLGVLLVVLLGSGLSGCGAITHRLAHEGTEGAQLAAQEEKEQKTPEEQALDDALARRQAEQMGRGMLDALTRPESPFQPPSAVTSRDVPPSSGPGVGGSGSFAGGSGASGASRLNSLSSSLATQAARGLGAELERQLGPDGTGPLGQSLSAAAGKIASSMVQQSRAELGALLPECAGLEGERALACRDAQVARLGASFSQGAAQGLLQALRPWLLVVTFAGGLVVGLLVFLSLSLVRANREATRRGLEPRQRLPA